MAKGYLFTHRFRCVPQITIKKEKRRGIASRFSILSLRYRLNYYSYFPVIALKKDINLQWCQNAEKMIKKTSFSITSWSFFSHFLAISWLFFYTWVIHDQITCNNGKPISCTKNPSMLLSERFSQLTHVSIRRDRVIISETNNSLPLVCNK